MSRIVLETSAATKLLFQKEYSDRTVALLADVARLRWHLLAPLLLPAEVSNVIRRKMRREGVSLPAALGALDRFLRLPISLAGGTDLFRRALVMTDQYGLSTYDAQYVALADMLSCDVWTADGGLLRAAGGRLPFIRWIGSYAGLTDT